MIKRNMLQYSGQLRLNKMISEPTCEQYADTNFNISNSLLHDVILLEVRAFVMKYEATKKRKEKERTNNLESKIDKLQNSQAEEDIKRVNNMKEVLQDIEVEREMVSARRYFANNQLEGERPMRFFCSMNKKIKSRAQFEEVHVKERNERGEEVTRIVKKQSSVEWEVRKYYWSLYRKEETFFDKQDFLERIGEVKGISEDDKCQLEKKITME